MALTAYCKKCNREVEPGDICPRCGTKLPKTATHAAWVMERRPAADWMCWNAAARVLLPAALVVVVLMLALEALSGGLEAVERLFQGSFPLTLLILMCALAAGILLALLLQGKDLTDYVVDSRGVHVTKYLPNPTPLKLLARLKSPRLMEQVDPESANPVLRLEEQDLPWREIARVQLWPEKCYLLFYAPAWWLRTAVRCTPFSWDDALYYVRDKLGRKKTVELPEHLRTQAEKKPAARRTGRAAGASLSEPASPPPAQAPDFREEPAFPGGGPEKTPPGEEDSPDAVPPSEGEQMSLDL